MWEPEDGARYQGGPRAVVLEKSQRRSTPSTPPLCQIQPLLRRTVPILMSSRLTTQSLASKPGG